MKKLKKIALSLPKYVSLACFAFTFQCTGLCIAAPNDQIGGVTFETEQKSGTPQQIQDDSISYFEGVVKAVETGATSVAPPEAKVMNYINSVYLYCTITNGVCPLPLNALLEMDLFNSLKNKQATCPILTSFWTAWLHDGFEKRQQFNTKTSSIGPAAQFTNTERPKYIKCQDTISRMMNDNQDGVSKRFGAGGEGHTTLSKFLELVKLIRDRKINVFTTGLVEPSSTKTASTKK